MKNAPEPVKTLADRLHQARRHWQIKREYCWTQAITFICLDLRHWADQNKLRDGPRFEELSWSWRDKEQPDPSSKVRYAT